MINVQCYMINAPHTVKSPLLLLVSTQFQVLFHSPSGVLFAFPSRYWFTIDRKTYLALERWSPQIQTGFLVPRST